jgi:hypothetical protein
VRPPFDTVRRTSTPVLETPVWRVSTVVLAVAWGCRAAVPSGAPCVYARCTCAPYESTKGTHFEHPWVLQVRPRSFPTLARSARSRLHRSRGGMENRPNRLLRHSRAAPFAAGGGLRTSSESSSESPPDRAGTRWPYIASQTATSGRGSLCIASVLRLARARPAAPPSQEWHVSWHERHYAPCG